MKGHAVSSEGLLRSLRLRRSGFLVGLLEYLDEKYTSAEGIHEHAENGKVYKTYTGDLLEKYRKHIATGLLTGFDFDSTMLRIAAMNATLHGVDTPRILYQDTLSTGFDTADSHDAFELILANPPFKGSLDFEDVSRSLTAKVKTKKTELLFLCSSCACSSSAAAHCSSCRTASCSVPRRRTSSCASCSSPRTSSRP
jgi:23S rRNA G2445 N2-methylase RlmL